MDTALASRFRRTFKFHWLPVTISDREKKRVRTVCVNQVECCIKQNSGIASRACEESENRFIICFLFRPETTVR